MIKTKDKQESADLPLKEVSEEFHNDLTLLGSLMLHRYFSKKDRLKKLADEMLSSER